MLQEALWMTVIGMGGVFAFLLILVAGILVLADVIKKTTQAKMDKIALAIAIAKSQE